MKLVIREAESDALESHLSAGAPRYASALVETEVRRAAWHRQERLATVNRIEAILLTLAVIPVDSHVLARAAAAPPRTLRTLDAIHIATALELGEELDALITYDHRLADAARAAGLRVLSPGASDA